MSEIKAVLFDLDDTLWPIVPAIARAERVLHDWLEQHAPAVAREVSIESLRARRDALMATDPIYQIDLLRLRRAVLEHAFAEHGEDPMLIEAALTEFSRARNQVELFDDVRPALQQLRRHVKLGSLSNGMADLTAIGLDELFEVSLAAFQLGRAKPDPSVFVAACDALEIQPEQAVYVGDDLLLDVAGAQSAGLTAVWLHRNLHPGKAQPLHVQPDAVCRDLHELHAWLAPRLPVT